MRKLLEWLMSKSNSDHYEVVREAALAEATQQAEEKSTTACFIASEYNLMSILDHCPENHVVVFARYNDKRIVSIPLDESARNLLEELQPNDCFSIEPDTFRVAINPSKCKSEGMAITVAKYMDAIKSDTAFDLITMWDYYPYPSWWEESKASE